MDSAPDDKVTVMSMRAAANQFGYLVGAAMGGLALAAGGFGAMGMAFSSLFALGALVHLAPRLRSVPRLGPDRSVGTEPRAAEAPA
jgi:predicted MFS family arabinose efflux permease